MKVLLAVFSCSSCSATLLRHWPYFHVQEADHYVVVTTTDKQCEVPEGALRMEVGTDSYINGDHLPKRMLDTMEKALDLEWDVLILAEYDTVFFKRIPLEDMFGDVAGHLAGFETWGSKAKRFYHNPWVFKREVVPTFIKYGRKSIEDGVCGRMTADAYGLPESSPDVFFGYITQELGLVVQVNLWTEFSRNALDKPGDLEEARASYLRGAYVIHGIKTKEELDYITQ